MRQYEQQINRIALKFTKKFFKEQYNEKANHNNYRIIWNLNIWLWPIVINDEYYFDIDWIVCTLKNNWSTDIIREYYNYRYELSEKWFDIPTVSFYNYWKRKILWDKEYERLEKEELKICEENVEKAKKLLFDSIKKDYN